MDKDLKLYACETKGHCLEKDVVEIMKILQQELKKRDYKAVVLGLIKDTKSLNEVLDTF